MRAQVTIDPRRTIGEIDPNIYGQFLCRRRGVADEGLYAPDHPDADETGLRKTVVDAIAATRTPVVRWPGGCTGTSYDWRDGIGPRDQRERTFDVHLGQDVGNGFGTAEFVAFCRRIGAEPHLNLNTGLGSLRDAVEWVEYCNLTTPTRWANRRRADGFDAPFDVRYWQIGNENYGRWEIGHQSPAEYAIMAREWAKTLKMVQPGLKVLAVGGSQRLPEWDAIVLEQALPHIDYLTAHRYWDFNGAIDDDQYDMIAGIGYLEEQVTRTVAQQIELVARELKANHRPKIAFTEWNCRNLQQREMASTWTPHGTQYRLTDALAVAGFLNMMQRQCANVGLASFAQSINVVGMLLVDDEHVIRETVYWPLLLLRTLSGSRAIDAWTECDGYTADFRGRPVVGIPYLDVSATASDDGDRLTLSIVNRHRHEALKTDIRLRDTRVAGSATLHRLWHENPNTRNTIEHPDAVAPTKQTLDIVGDRFTVALPPHSLTILELPLG